ncbi:MAG: DUF5916 domain-containing protein [Balneolaceae bacterium]
MEKNQLKPLKWSVVNFFIWMMIIFLKGASIGYAFQTVSLQDQGSISSSVNSHYELHIQKMSGIITLDGVIDEGDWIQADVADEFFMVTPYDTSYSEAKSEIRMTYDEDAIYLSLIFFDVISAPRVVESLRRDFAFGTNDNFLLFLDPFNDLTTGYSFGVNAAGAKWDGTMSSGSAVDLAWDAKWEVVVRDYDDKWIAEMRIPFKSIRYKAGLDSWNINFSRLDLSINEKSAWAPVPRQFPTASLAFTGKLKWDQPPPDPGLQLSIIPYVFGGASRDFEFEDETNYRTDFGMDAKLALSSSLNLDLTYNPDFSQADVDQQITNLDRFELFFPEKRQFFLENSDLFANFGSNRIRPFFSRRIGIDAPVLAGARLSGNLGQDWRIGVMNMFTEESDMAPASNFFVATIQKQVFSRSNISAILVDRQNVDESAFENIGSYNRTGGLQFNLATQDNRWSGRVFAFKSFTDGLDQGSDFAQGTILAYSRQRVRLEFLQQYVGEQYFAGAGFVPRTNFFQLEPTATVRFYPDNSPIIYHGAQVSVESFFTPDNFSLTERESNLGYFFSFHNLSQIDIVFSHNYVELQRDFDPTNSNIAFLASGTDYNWLNAFVRYRSDTRKLFKYSASVGSGGFYNGNRTYFQADVNYRYQPYGSISMAASYNYLDLPEPWNQNSFWLIGPKVDITFTNSLFFTTFVQYNEQLDNLNINSRLQWRYSPVSDIFVVYTDNYFPETMDSRNRAVVFKMSYWFN